MTVDSSEKKTAKPRGWWFERMLVSWVLWMVAVVGLAVVAAGTVGFVVYDEVVQAGEAGETVDVTVPQGATGAEIAELLAAAGLVEHPIIFRLAMRLDDANVPLQHGVYELPEGYSAMQLLTLLQEGPDRHLLMNQVRITIPEGLTIAQMDALDTVPEGFAEEAAKPKYLEKLGLEEGSLEGFLMPETYFFDEQPTAAMLVERMLDHFVEEYAALTKAIPGSDALDRHTIVTVASLVEEEARVDHERPAIAAVVWNRLENGMPLQFDSTLQYALGAYGRRLLNADKEVDSPYNTYKYRGLPPGPISNPGVQSIRAAIQPAQVDYLFFVSNADGKTHTFSETAREHERAVARFRKEIAVQRAEERRQEQGAP